MRTVRVLITKLGLDGHDLGAKWVARALREAGMEVIYTGRQQSPEQAASAALQEAVDVVGVSFMSGAHLGLTRKLMEQLRESGMEDKMVILGGVVPKEDIPALKAMGVLEVFPVGTPVERIVQTINDNLNR